MGVCRVSPPPPSGRRLQGARRATGRTPCLPRARPPAASSRISPMADQVDSRFRPAWLRHQPIVAGRSTMAERQGLFDYRRRTTPQRDWERGLASHWKHPPGASADHLPRSASPGRAEGSSVTGPAVIRAAPTNIEPCSHKYYVPPLLTQRCVVSRYCATAALAVSDSQMVSSSNEAMVTLNAPIKMARTDKASSPLTEREDFKAWMDTCSRWIRSPRSSGSAGTRF